MKFKFPKIAVVSMAGIFPGALDTDRFIANILQGKSAVTNVPEGLWPAPTERMVAKGAVTEDRARCDRAGLIHDFTFNPSGFDMDPDLLMRLDPVHHLVLTAGRRLMQGCRTDEATLKRTGVILAAIALPTKNSGALARTLSCATELPQIHPYDAMGATVVGTPAALLARAFSCNGGSFTLDAACASSLFSIKLACEHLLTHRADMMIAGGVSRPDSLYTQVGFSQLAALSPSGRCAPFDCGADGLVVGEGTGLVALKRLPDALACGDTIHGVITGWGVSNDIEGNLVAPASEGQVRAMVKAYEMAGWTPSDIQYMECHGSGTAKGDQVELTSIRSLAEHFGALGTPISIGSVKSMVGHMLTAAGAAGFIKTLLSMKAATLPPSLNFTQFPENSPAAGTGIRVQDRPMPWQPAASGLPRRAGVSAFGFGGINAHILVEEFSPAKNEPRRIHAVPSTFPGAVPCAIVGVGLLSPCADSLETIGTLVSGKKMPVPGPPGQRWRNPFAAACADRLDTLFLQELVLDLKDFHIPPNQLSDILIQHLVMLKAAQKALQDASIPPRPGAKAPRRLNMGAAIGIDFDFGAADFFTRWSLHTYPRHMADAVSPPLTFDRTLGALGGIVASRIAREFKLGGPSFTLSAGQASGIKAVETGMTSLAAGETTTFICGAVDMAGDLCSFQINRALGAFNSGYLPSEGAAALVLKTLDRARMDGDRIYAVIRGTGGSCGAPLAVETKPSTDLAGLSLARAVTHANTHAPEGEGLRVGPGEPVDPFQRLGDLGAAGGLFNVIAAAGMLTKGKIASVAARTLDGTFAHLIMEGPNTAVSPGPQVPAMAHPIRLSATKPQIPEKVIRALSPAKAAAAPAPAGSWNISESIARTGAATARAHERFLELSSHNMAQMGKQMAALAGAAPPPVPIFLDRDQCLEYAVGKAGNVLGPDFDIIDTYPVRVRLPDEPLMLVDRIMSIEGEKRSLTRGKIVTQHDVLEGAWYLDGGKAPVSISIEAGQADLFLCAYLGIDHQVRGTRKYRLLDAKVTFERPLPCSGETIEYHIEIDRFLRQGEIYLFFFHYRGYIDGLPFITMRDGCAGFFTEKEVENSGGIILKKEDLQKIKPAAPLPALVPIKKTALSDAKVEALRKGDLETAFGPVFKGITIGENQWLPSGRMTLIHRVLSLDPQGGRYGMGRIVAEADIHPDDWFLTCHFIDDQVMPGTLMYECCAHALRIFVQRMGWVSPDPKVHYDVRPSNESDLKCRGPVTPMTKKARYDIEIKAAGFDPEPYVIADAHMFSDDLRIVLYRNMGMTLSGVTRSQLTQIWSAR